MRVLFFSLFLIHGINGINGDPTKTIVENAVAMESLSSLADILTSKGYEEVLNALNGTGPFTLFAPTNTAWNSTRLNISKHVDEVIATLYYHALGSAINSSSLTYLQFPESLSKDSKYVNVGDGKGQVLFIEKDAGNVSIYFSNLTAKVVMADIICSNGIMHVIDQVVTLPPVMSNVIKWSGLETLYAAILKASLESAINNTAGITLFAPTDVAFAAAGINVTTMPVETLVKYLKYHVVPSIAYTPDIKDGQNATTLQGGSVTFHHKTGSEQYTVNDANITVANVLAQNGVAHFIDAVLVPATIINVL